jgi:hypothetical protein
MLSKIQEKMTALCKGVNLERV